MVSTDAGGGTGGSWRIAQAAVLVLVAGYFLYSLRTLLNPFLIYCVFIALLAPFRGVRGHALTVTVATILVALWVLDTAGSLLAPFFLAFVLAYILDPLADRVSAHPRIGRTLAIFLILVPFLAVGALAVVFGVPEIVQQVRALIGEVPRALNAFTTWMQGLTAASLGFDIPFVDEATLLARVQAIDGQMIAEFLESRRADLTERAWATVLGLGRGFGSLLVILGYIVLTPVLMFYVLRDYDRIVARVGDLLPARIRPGATDFLREYDALLSRYLRGQVSASLLTGAITWLGLLIVGFPYSFLLGATVAVLGIVPYLGVGVSLVPAIIIALVSDNIGLSLVKVAAVYGAAQALESTVISPRIVGESVGLHPVWIVLSLSLGGFFFGFAGLLIGVPVAVGAKLLLVRGLDRYRSSTLYTEEEVPSQ